MMNSDPSDFNTLLKFESRYDANGNTSGEDQKIIIKSPNSHKTYSNLTTGTHEKMDISLNVENLPTLYKSTFLEELLRMIR